MFSLSLSAEMSDYVRSTGGAAATQQAKLWKRASSSDGDFRCRSAPAVTGEDAVAAGLT